MEERYEHALRMIGKKKLPADLKKALDTVHYLVGLAAPDTGRGIGKLRSRQVIAIIVLVWQANLKQRKQPAMMTKKQIGGVPRTSIK
jgi:hypothetical protein